MTKGIDIYRYQTVTSWTAVKNSGVTYVWVKLTDGGGKAVVAGDGQVRGAKSVGIPVGGYHYAQFSPSPETQADVFLGEVRRLGATGVVPMLDMEAPFTPGSAAKDFSIRFCRRVAAAGFRPGVYMNESFAKVLRPDLWGIPDLVIWIAKYGGKPAYGGRYDVHQYSSSGSVPGISGSVDMNESYTNNHLTSSQGGGVSPTPETPASTKGIEIMATIVVPKSLEKTSIRIRKLPGGPNAKLVVRPGIAPDGFAVNPVWQGEILAWGSGKSGVGGNPLQDGRPDFPVNTDTEFPLPNALWCDFFYSSTEDFEIDVIG